MILKVLKKVIIVIFFLLIIANTIALLLIIKEPKKIEEIYKNTYTPPIQLELFYRDDLTDGEENLEKYTVVYLIPAPFFFCGNIFEIPQFAANSTKLDAWNRFRQIRFYIDDNLVLDKLHDFSRPINTNPRLSGELQVQSQIAYYKKYKVKVRRGSHTVKYIDLLYGIECNQVFVADQTEKWINITYIEDKNGQTNVEISFEVGLF